jgi:multiple sugar transport system ATP-binding protein
MDEPLSNLDAKLRVQMRAELVKLHRRLGVTTIYVTHDQTEAMTLGQRVAVLHRGVVQQVDTPQRLYQHPANTFVASFIGSPPMNFIRGHLGEAGVRLGETKLPLPPAVTSRIHSQTNEVIVGLRPEEFGSGSGPLVRAKVEITEQLGPETLAYFRVEGFDVLEVGERPVELAGALSARLEPQTRALAGESMDLAINLERIHLFDTATGESLLR